MPKGLRQIRRQPLCCKGSKSVSELFMNLVCDAAKGKLVQHIAGGS